MKIPLNVRYRNLSFAGTNANEFRVSNRNIVGKIGLEMQSVAMVE
jgi:hypothetical protein